MKPQFITPCKRERYIKECEEYLAIEYSQDFNYIIHSGKSILIWNYYSCFRPGNFSEKIKYDVWNYAKQNGLPIYCMERGGLPNTVYFDSNGLCTESRSYDRFLNHSTQPDVEDYLLNLELGDTSLEDQINNRINFNLLKSEFKTYKYDKTIFIPLQVQFDTTILTGSDVNVKDFLLFIEKFAIAHPNYLFLVKSHPLDKILINESENLKCVDTYHYKDCIAMSSHVVCINSGVGLQTLVWGKPVFTFGKSYYTYPGLATASNWKTLSDDLRNAQVPDRIIVKQFYSFLINEFYTKCDTKSFKLLEAPKFI